MLTAAERQVLEIGESAAVTGSGLTLYYSDGTHTYTMPAAKGAEFTYLDGKWESAETAPAYTLAASAGEHGAITETATVTPGDSKAFTVTADSGYVISTLTVDGSSVSAAANQSAYTYTFSNVTAAHTIAATFIQVHTITASAGEHGSISPSGSVAVAEGADRAFTFTPESGYHVDTVTVDGKSAGSDSSYTFTNVTSDRSISVSFAQDNGSNPPVGTPDYAGAKAGIKGRHWAYYTTEATAEAIKAAFSAELWDMLDHEYPGVFANSAAASDAVIVTGDGTTTAGSELGSSYPYYTYSVVLNAENTVTGQICALDAANKFVVRTTVGGTDTFTVMTKPASGDALLVADYDEGGIEVFGNGAAAVGSKGKTDASAAFHVTDERVGGSAINCTLVVYKPTFEGLKLTRSGSGGTAAAWDFGSYPFVSIAGTSEETPAVFETFFGDSSLSFQSPMYDNGQLITIIAVNTLLPDSATISTASEFTVSFTSNFYDEVPLKITYKVGNGPQKIGYLLIKRVGIDIRAYRKAGDAADNDLNLLHGTQRGTTYTDFYAENDCGVFATFYYPTNNTAQVELAATYTWQDGSMTRQTISKPVRTGASSGLVAADDFQLYAGTAAGLPVKIEVTAVKTGSSDTSFAGASLGSGAGVVWVCPDDLRN